MINKKELEIANTSYTNKDFGVIYTEILDIASKLSALWKPESSNESDPGVVLLKLLAFIGDKLNYNIDKNTLENFMPSATQESSMRKLCDMMGYYMNYYISASTNVTFTYRGKALDYDDAADTDSKYMTLYKFNTVIANSDSSLQYVLWEDVSLDTLNRTRSALAIEGYLNTLNVGDSDKITLDNLDSLNRIYFGEKQVAQNGIVIKPYGELDSSTTFWKLVENLNTQQPGSKCYKFGYDSKKGLPYIEFPADISSLIGDGLSIRYMVTSGYYGNVGVGTLTKLLSPTSVDIKKLDEVVNTLSFTEDEGSGDLLIKNNSAALTGSDPESIDSAYNNFKKTIGTFDTLVTCRDYANYIYNYIVNGAGVPIVSNVQTGDRRLDLSNSKNIITYGDNGQYLTNTSTDYTKLFIHALKGIYNPANESEYNDSFKLMTDISTISSWLEYDDSPANISYEYSKGSTGDIGLIKILYDLDVKITTTYKVNAAEQLDIKKSIIENLRKNFYSRNIDYGYEIPYETIYNCIMNSDSRIKSISLKEPELSTRYIDIDNNILKTEGTADAAIGGEEVPYSNSPYLMVLAKNVLAGRVPLFNYDSRFRYEFGMSKYPATLESGETVIGPVISNVERFTSNTNITLSETDYKVKSNEVIQLIGPNLVDEVEYTTYVNYYSNFDITADVDTKLGTNDLLLLVYQDTSQNQIEVLYKDGDIIRSTFDIHAADFTDETITKKIKILRTASIPGYGSNVPCLGIPTDASIFKRNVVRHTFNSTIKVAWLVSDTVENNILSDKIAYVSGTSDPYIYEYILGDNDSFIYSLDGESSYEIFGSGTSIRIESSQPIFVSNFFSGACNIPNLDDLYEYGIEALNDVLKSITFTNGAKFVIQVNKILTLADGDVAHIEGLESGDTPPTLNNQWSEFDYTLKYNLLGQDSETTYETLLPYDIGEGVYNNWRIRSRLDLVSGPNKTQILQPGQSIIFYKTGPSETLSYTIEGDRQGRIRTNLSVDLPGGTDIPLNIVDPTSILSDIVYPVSVLVFTDEGDKAENFARTNGYYVKEISTSALSDFTTGYKVLQPNDLTNGKVLLMLYVSFLDISGEGSKITISGYNSTTTFNSGTQVTITNYADGQSVSDITPDGGNTKLYVLELPSNCVYLKIVPTIPSGTTSIGTVTVGELKPTDGFNKRFNLKEIEEESSITTGQLSTALKKIIEYVDSGSLFYYTCELEKSEEIEEEDLSSPFIFFDHNNMASRFAIAYIDIANSEIEITRSSKL